MYTPTHIYTQIHWLVECYISDIRERFILRFRHQVSCALMISNFIVGPQCEKEEETPKISK